MTISPKSSDYSRVPSDSIDSQDLLISSLNYDWLASCIADKLAPLLAAQIPSRTPSTTAKSNAQHHQQMQNLVPTKFRRDHSNTVYLPELDYVIGITRVRDEFRKGTYTPQGQLKLHKKQGNPYMYGYEIIAPLQKKHEVVIPSTALYRDVTDRYTVEFKSDYRTQPRAQSYYMKGVMDAGNDNAPYKTNASCYVIDMQAPLSSTVIDATEAYWRSISPEEEAMRIISKADMLRLCAEFRAGIKSPQNVPWRVITLENGQPASPSTPPADLLNPRRITVQGYEQRKELVSSDDDWPEDFSQD